MKTLSTEEIQKESSKVWERLFQMPEYQTARSVALFLSMPKGEICTDAVVEDAVTQGKDIYVPQVGKNFEQADMEMLKVTEPKTTDGTLFHKAWPRNKWGEYLQASFDTSCTGIVNASLLAYGACIEISSPHVIHDCSIHIV